MKQGLTVFPFLCHKIESSKFLGGVLVRHLEFVLGVDAQIFVTQYMNIRQMPLLKIVCVFSNETGEENYRTTET